MSQAIIDFCEGLKTTLLGVEEQLGKAKTALDAGASQAAGEAQKHIADATEQLAAFRTHAGLMAQAISAELPGQAAGAKEKLGEFGQEAQVALRHVAVFLAEAASKGAHGAAGALHAGAKQASALAEKLRHETAVSVPETPEGGGPSNPT